MFEGLQIGFNDVMQILILYFGVYALIRYVKGTRSAQVLLGFWTLFLVSHLIGFFDLQTSADLQQYVKGIVKWLIHFGFLVGAVTWLYRRGQDYYWKSLAVFALGVVGNAAFGVLELLAAHAGTNLDSFTVQPLTGGASQINVYGAVEGTSVFRPNALTGDPNHLGIMIIAPLLVLAPLYLRLERGHRLRRHLGLAIAFLSRSGGVISSMSTPSTR